MKFGHDMHRVVRVSDAEWAPYFMQYKLLKKCIKQIRAEPSSPPVPPRAADEEAGEKATMAKSAPEVAFFRALRFELQKSAQFFRQAELVLEVRRERVREALRQLQDEDRLGLLEDAPDRALRACVTYYRDLLLLENYAIMNYCGFSKILKKHDKQTGFTTRTQFMRVCVAPQPFTRYPRLMEMIREAEDLYRDIAAASDRIRGTRSVDPPPLSPSSSSQQLSTLGGVGAAETDALDAILNLREAASRIREGEEDPDAAAAAAAPPAAAPRPAFAGPAADGRRARRRSARARTDLRPPLCSTTSPAPLSVTQLRHPTRGCHCFFARAGLLGVARGSGGPASGPTRVCYICHTGAKRPRAGQKPAFYRRGHPFFRDTPRCADATGRAREGTRERPRDAPAPRR